MRCHGRSTDVFCGDGMCRAGVQRNQRWPCGVDEPCGPGTTSDGCVTVADDHDDRGWDADAGRARTCVARTGAPGTGSPNTGDARANDTGAGDTGTCDADAGHGCAGASGVDLVRVSDGKADGTYACCIYVGLAFTSHAYDDVRARNIRTHPPHTRRIHAGASPTAGLVAGHGHAAAHVYAGNIRARRIHAGYSHAARLVTGRGHAAHPDAADVYAGNR